MPIAEKMILDIQFMYAKFRVSFQKIRHLHRELRRLPFLHRRVGRTSQNTPHLLQPELMMNFQLTMHLVLNIHQINQHLVRTFLNPRTQRMLQYFLNMVI